MITNRKTSCIIRVLTAAVILAALMLIPACGKLEGNGEDRAHSLEFNSFSVRCQPAFEGPVYEDCLNSDLLFAPMDREEYVASHPDYDPRIAHQPVFRIDTSKDLRVFAESLEETVGPVFEDLMNQYDDGFFKTHSLIVAFCDSGSGSLLYDVKEIMVEHGKLCMEIIQTNFPEMMTDDEVGWLIFAEVADKDLTFRAYLRIRNRLSFAPR